MTTEQEARVRPTSESRGKNLRDSTAFGRGSWIRTNDLQYPKLPRYQAALYPDYLGNDVDTRLSRCQQGGFRPPQCPLNSGCATWSPGAIPYFFAVPAITSSTPFASPLEGMILVDCGSVFSAIRRIRPSARMKIMSREMNVFFIHIDTSCSGEKSNSIPFPSGSSFRYIRPVVFSSSVVAISTENICTPDLVTISSGWMLAARPPKAETTQTAKPAAKGIQSRARKRSGSTPRPKFINTMLAAALEGFRLGRP